MTTQIPDRSNSREFARHISIVTAAFTEGKKVEYRWRSVSADRNPGQWQALFEDRPPAWNFEACDYRIAPEPPKEQWLPFTFETAPMMAKARRKCDRFTNCTLLCNSGFAFGGLLYPFQRAFDELEQLDGTPLGVKVESEPEWPRWFLTEETKSLWRYDSEDSATFYANRGDNFFEQKTEILPGMDNKYLTNITAAEAAELLAKGAKE